VCALLDAVEALARGDRLIESGRPFWVMPIRIYPREIFMGASSAVTINRSEQEITSQLSEADPLLSAENVRISYGPAPGDRGTEVRVVLEQSVPGGALGQKVAAVVGADPQRQLDDALRRFKQLVETGEVIRSEGSPGGTDAKQQRSQRPAKPVVTDQ
jgi:hypothetical protein